MDGDAAQTAGDDLPARTGRLRDRTVDERVLRVAREISASLGPDAVSISAVARAAGVAKSTIYRRWETKAALLAAALEDVVGPHGSPPDTGRVHDDLVALVEDQLERLGPRPLVRLAWLSTAATTADSDAEGRLRVAAQARRQELDSVLRAGVRRGELHADIDVDVAVDLLSGAALGRAVGFDTVEDVHRFAHAVVGLVLHGLLARERS